MLLALLAVGAEPAAPTAAAIKAAADYSHSERGQTCVVMFDGRVVFERYDSGGAGDRESPVRGPSWEEIVGKQRLYVIPSRKLVVVRQGGLSPGFSDLEFLGLLLRNTSAPATTGRSPSATRRRPDGRSASP